MSCKFPPWLFQLREWAHDIALANIARFEHGRDPVKLSWLQDCVSCEASMHQTLWSVVRRRPFRV